MAPTSDTTARPPAPTPDTSGHRLRAAVLGTALGLSAAAAFTILSAESVVRGGVQGYRDVFWLVPGVLTIGAFHVVHRLHEGRAGRWEAVSYWVSQVALVLSMTGTAAWGLGVEALAFVGFPLGAMVWMAGLISWGAALLRARVLRPSAGWVLILLEPGSIALGVLMAPIAGLSDYGNYSGALAKAVALAVVALALREYAREQATPAERSDRGASGAPTAGAAGR